MPTQIAAGIPRIAVAGNPNAGKTCIFNGLTGLNQTVGNYPGVTVEMKAGRANYGGQQIEFVDLPGTYSLAAFSQDELVARNYIIEERPDVVLNVVDASNLERNLYLTTQLMEMRTPLVLALNMTDIAARRGIKIDPARLGKLLGVKVVPTVGNTGAGLDQIMEACLELAGRQKPLTAPVTYGHMVENEVARLSLLVGADPKLAGVFDPRWAAVKLIERDETVLARIR